MANITLEVRVLELETKVSSLEEMVVFLKNDILKLIDALNNGTQEVVNAKRKPQRKR